MSPSSISTVSATGHRVVISMSSTQTVLWDQIEFHGNPSDFAWVLPVQKGAYVQVASDAFLEALDAGTSVRVESSALDCPSSSSFDCSCAPGATASGSGPDYSSSVTVVHQGSVGPYDTVTISSDAGNGAIADWLTTNGYAIPADVAPILDDYVAQKFDFIAIKLQPNQGIQTMKPVRVVTPGGSPTFPLKMLAAGADKTVSLVLYVLSEGRVEVSGFKNAAIATNDVVFNFSAQQSNYGALRDSIFVAHPDTFVTMSAAKNTLLDPNRNAMDSNPYAWGGHSIADGYFEQALTNGETLDDCSVIRSNAAGYSSSYDMVANPCPYPESPDICGDLLPFRIDSRFFSCGELTDLSVALTGLHPVDVWLTRLEARLPKELLQQDLTLVPASSQSEQPFFISATKGINAPCDLASANISGIRPSGNATAIMTALLGLFVTVGRRRIRKNPSNA